MLVRKTAMVRCLSGEDLYSLWFAPDFAVWFAGRGESGSSLRGYLFGVGHSPLLRFPSMTCVPGGAMICQGVAGCAKLLRV